MSTEEAARRIGLSPRTARAWARRYGLGHEVSPRLRLLGPGDLERLRQLAERLRERRRERAQLSEEVDARASEAGSRATTTEGEDETPRG